MAVADIEAFHALERDRNALKEPIRQHAREEEGQARQAAEKAWREIDAAFEHQEEALNVTKSRQ